MYVKKISNLKSLSLIATSIIAVNVSSHALAYQILPNPNYGSIVLHYSDFDVPENYLTPFENFEYLKVDSYVTLKNYGDLQNYKWFELGDNYSGGAYIENYGSLSNHNVFNFSDDSFINGGGSINNSGHFASGGSGVIAISSLDNSGLFESPDVFSNTVTNSGNFINRTFADVETFTNTGLFQNPFSTVIGSKYLQTDGETLNYNGEIKFTSIEILGGNLKGTGTLVGDVIIGSSATVIPGSSPGTLNIDGDLHSDGNYVFEIAGVNSGQYDVLDIDGNAFFTGGNFKFDFIDGFIPSIGDHWDFLVADSLNGFDKVGFTFAGLGDGLGIDLNTEGGKISLTVITAVPEPETYAMLLAGLGVMGFMAYRRKLKEAA